MEFFTFDDDYVRRLKDHDPETQDHFDQYFREALSAKLRNRVPAHDVKDIIQEVLKRGWSLPTTSKTSFRKF